MLPTRRIVLALALCAVLAPAAHAQINLAWNNCITQATAAENIQYACDGSRNGTPFRLVPSFFAPIDLPQFVGIEMIIDIGLPMDGPPLPNTPPLADWWRLGVGECRDGNLSFPVSLTGIGTGTTGVCRNPWVGANTGGGYNYNSTYLPNVARLRLAFADAFLAAYLVTPWPVGELVHVTWSRFLVELLPPILMLAAWPLARLLAGSTPPAAGDLDEVAG